MFRDFVDEDAAIFLSCATQDIQGEIPRCILFADDLVLIREKR